MRKIILIIATTLFAVSAFADYSVIEKVAEKLKANDVKTVIMEVEGTAGDPCTPAGKSYRVELQVKVARYSNKKKDVVHIWETVKAIGVDKDGKVTDFCRG